MKGVNLLFYLSIAIVIIAISLYFIKYYQKQEPFGDFYTNEDTFTKSQGTFFGDSVNRSLMTRKGLKDDMKNLNKVLFNVDVMASKNRLPDSLPFDPEDDPAVNFEERNNKECKPITGPKYMSINHPGTVISCGWWHYTSEDKQSVAELGTVNGPLDDNFLKSNPGGIWVWDKEEAQKLEDIKACSSVRSCETADIKPNCGFCLDKGIAVPVSNGKSKYATDINLACENVVVDPKKCPPPETIKISKTIYTNEGQTLKSGDMYRGEIIPYETTVLTDLCTLNPLTGTISKECLLSLIRTLGYTDNGVIAKILMGDKDGYYTRLGENYNMYQITKSILKKDAIFDLKGELVGDGRIRKQDATNMYKIIIDYAKNHGDKRVKNACIWLVYGIDYDPCEYDPDKKGPFDMYCLERVALESGCQRDGFKFPSVTTADSYNLLKWADFVNYFKELFESMRNKTDATKQKKNVLDCLGISMATDLSTLCAYKGEKCRLQTEEELLKNPAITKSKLQEAYYINKAKNATTPIDKQLTQEMAEEAKKITVKTLAILRSINKKACPPGSPIASWDFSQQRLDDRLCRFKSKVKKVVQNPQGARFYGNDSYIKVQGPISTDTFKTITMMVYINSFTGGYPRLWELTNVALGGSGCADQILGCLGPDSKMGIGMYSQKGCVGPSMWAVPEEGALMEKKWYHLGWAIDADFKGMTLFINGIQRQRFTTLSADTAFKNRVFDTLYIGTSAEQYNKDFLISWVRIFDYTLDEILCKKDMENKWIMPAYSPTLCMIPPTPLPAGAKCFGGFFFNKLGDFKLGLIDDRVDYNRNKNPAYQTGGWIWTASRDNWKNIGQRNETYSHVFLTTKDDNGVNVVEIMNSIQKKYGIPTRIQREGPPYINYYLKHKTKDSSIMLMKGGVIEDIGMGLGAIMGMYQGNNWTVGYQSEINRQYVIDQVGETKGTPQLNESYELYYSISNQECEGSLDEVNPKSDPKVPDCKAGKVMIYQHCTGDPNPGVHGWDKEFCVGEHDMNSELSRELSDASYAKVPPGLKLTIWTGNFDGRSKVIGPNEEFNFCSDGGWANDSIRSMRIEKAR